MCTRRIYQCLWALGVIIMLLSLTTGGRAQTPEWLVYNTANSELPGNQVLELVCDPRGAIWIGTYLHGLAKFDGETWTVYTQDNSGLSSKTVQAMAFDDRSDLWVGTSNGLGLFDGQIWLKFTPENSDVPYPAIHALAFDTQGMLWVGTGIFHDVGGGGLAKLNRRSLQGDVYTTKNSDLPDDQILSLAVDGQERLWIGTVNGKVAMFDGNTWTVYTSDDPGRPWGPVPALVCDAQGTIWAGTDGGGLARFDGTTWTGYTTHNSELPDNEVHALAIDAQGILWAGTSNGLAKFDEETWTVYTSDNSGLPNDRVWALASDLQENLWIGTELGGVAIYREGGVLFPEQATGIDDLVGIWKGWFQGTVAYRQFEADGTLKCALGKIERLQNPSSLMYSGRFWFESGLLKITETLQPNPGAYKVLVRKRDGQPVHLSFHDMGDPDPIRAYDWGRGMTRVE